VVVLHDWSIHGLLAQVTLGAGDVLAYIREMRRAHGQTGAFVARQVARGLGGPLLPSLLAANDRLFEGCLGVVAVTEGLGRRTARRLPGRPVMALPLDFLRPAVAVPPRENRTRPAARSQWLAAGTCQGTSDALADARQQGIAGAAGVAPPRWGSSRRRSAMTFLSLSLITLWLGLVVLGISLAGFVHLLALAAGAIVFLTGNRGSSREADATAG